MLKDQSRAGELRIATGERGGEATLVVVVAVALGVVFTTDVDDGVACFEDFGVAGANELRVVVGWEHAKHVYGEGFVGVEVAVVGADFGTGFETFGCGFGHGGDEATEHELLVCVEGVYLVLALPVVGEKEMCLKVGCEAGWC